jgi:hypothetical protein
MSCSAQQLDRAVRPQSVSPGIPLRKGSRGLSKPMVPRKDGRELLPFVLQATENNSFRYDRRPRGAPACGPFFRNQRNCFTMHRLPLPPEMPQ